MKCCEGCTCEHVTVLRYGPIGDPLSTDAFERAQAQAPAGWHVEGQTIGGWMTATTKDHPSERVFGFGAAALVVAMEKAGPR